MADFQYKGQGLRSVGAYQVSGIPFITGSDGPMAYGDEARIRFPYVSKSVTVINSGSAGDLRVHFNSSSAGDVTSDNAHHYVTLAGDQSSITFNVKCKEVYVTALASTVGFELFAELTNIHTGSMYDLTGSGLTDVGPSSNPT